MNRALVILGLTLCTPLLGQRSTTGTQTQSAAEAAQVVRTDLEFEDLWEAQAKMSYGVTQVRRVRGVSARARFSSVREHLLHDVGLDGRERISVTLEAVPDPTAPAGSVALHQAIYANRAGFIFFFQSFRVHDIEKAEANYGIYPVVRTEYLGRPVDRYVVYPLRWDRSIWVLDVDVKTCYPLVSREYNSQAQLLSEVIVERFEAGADALDEGNRWKPAGVVSRFESIEEAGASFDNDALLRLDASLLPPDYEESQAQVVENYLDGQVSYVSIFTDGIDNVFLIQASDADDPMSFLDGLNLGDRGASQTILQYTDMNIAQYVFGTRDMRYQVLGRSSLQDLKAAAARILVEALNR